MKDELLKAEFHSPQQLKSLLRSVCNQRTFNFNQKLWLFDQLKLHGAAKVALPLLSELLSAKIPEVMKNRLEADRRFLLLVEKIFSLEKEPTLTEALLSQTDTLIRAKEDAKALLVVLPTVYNNMMISFPVLLAFFRAFGLGRTDMLVLKAHISQFGPKGTSLATGLERLESKLRPIICRNRGKRIVFMGASSGGFPAGYLASRLGATGAILFGSSTDLSDKSTLPRRRSRLSNGQEVKLWNEDTDRANWDLKTKEGISKLEFIDLYCGEWDRIDRLHAAHLHDLPNVKVQIVPETFHHCIISLASECHFWGAVSNRLHPNGAHTMCNRPAATAVTDP